MKREVIRVEPAVHLYREVEGADIMPSPGTVTRFTSRGFPPFDPETGEIVNAPIERQTELVWSS